MSKKSVLAYVFTLCCLMVFLAIVGFKKPRQIEFPEDGLLMMLQVRPTFGQDDKNENIIYKVHQGGLIEKSSKKASNSKESPVLRSSKYISPDSIRALQNLINLERFAELPEEIGTNATDGSFYSISIYGKDRIYHVEGLNPENRRFMTLANAIMELFD